MAGCQGRVELRVGIASGGAHEGVCRGDARVRKRPQEAHEIRARDFAGAVGECVRNGRDEGGQLPAQETAGPIEAADIAYIFCGSVMDVD
jgi:hypothetical protein